MSKNTLAVIALGWFLVACGSPKPIPSIPVSTGTAVDSTEGALTSMELPQGILVPKGLPENWVYTEVSGFPEYLIGRGDVLEIYFAQGTEKTIETITVRPDGKIYFSLLSGVQASGLTPTQLDDALTGKLAELFRNPQIEVFVKEYNSKRVRVFGALSIGYYTAARSGAGIYALKGKTTALDIILEAGGATPDARLDRVKLMRGGRLYSLDLERALLYGDQSQNVILEGGDVIYIPSLTRTGKKVIVMGEAEAPSIYPFSEDTRLLEAIMQAGGFTDFAVWEDVKIIRGGMESPQVLSLNVKQMIDHIDFTQNVLLENGDIIYIPRTFLGDVNLFFTKINPILGFMIASYRDTRTLGGILGVDEKTAKMWEETTWPYTTTSGLPKQAAPPAYDEEKQDEEKE